VKVIDVQRTWDDQRIKRDRLAQLQAQMRQQDVGALYLTEQAIYGRYVLNTRVPGGTVFVPVAGEPIAIVRRRDFGYVQQQHPNTRLPFERQGSGSTRTDAGEGNDADALGEGVAALMREQGLEGERLGVDMLEPSAYASFMRAEIPLVDAGTVFERAWTVKTPDEIEIYRAVGRQYEYAMTAFRDALRPGISEAELAVIVTGAWHEAGGEDIAQLNVCVADNMNPWKRWPTDRRVRAGEFAGIDLHGRGINGLRGDASRTYLVGDQPSAAQRDLYRRAYEYLQGSIPVWRAGRTIQDAMNDVPKVPPEYEAHLFDYNRAHGVGLGSSDYPHINPRRAAIDDVLRPNQILAVECYFARENDPLCVKLEEQIIVRDGPPELIGPDIPFDRRLLE
jgi:Xaa-Pro aminopeptidase